MPELILYWQSLSTPLGQMRFACDGQQQLRALDWTDTGLRLERLLRCQYRHTELIHRPATALSAVATQLDAYFAGDLQALAVIAYQVAGSEFQRAVWQLLTQLPAGSTSHYQQLAQRLGRPQAARAIGAVNAANPISLVIPCHRLVAKQGALTGYAGGLERKGWLLEHESALMASCCSAGSA